MGFNFKQLLCVAYPSLCAHCHTPIDEGIFCRVCLELLTLAETKGKCRSCFAELEKGGCSRCRKRHYVIHRQLAACESFGPARTLSLGLANGRREWILAAASLMAYQLTAQNSPLPEILIPMPISFWQKQRHGFDLNALLAQQIGKILSVPTLAALQQKLDSEYFFAEGKIRAKYQLRASIAPSLIDRHLLLIAPTLDDDALRRAALQLKLAFPACTYALALLT